MNTKIQRSSRVCRKTHSRGFLPPSANSLSGHKVSAPTRGSSGISTSMLQSKMRNNAGAQPPIRKSMFVTQTVLQRATHHLSARRGSHIVPAGKVWSNWERNIVAEGAQRYTFRLPNIEITNEKMASEVFEELKNIKRKHSSLRFVGGGHSFSPLVADPRFNGAVIHSSELRHITLPGPGQKIVRVGPGRVNGELGAEMTNHNLSIPTNGAVRTNITIGGFVAGGCHGTGWDYGPICENQQENGISTTGKPLRKGGLNSVTILGSEGKLHHFNTASPEWDLVKVNLGLLGPITEIGLAVEKQFNILSGDKVVPMPQIFENLPAFLHKYDYLELFYMPFAPHHIVSETTYTDKTVWVKSGTIDTSNRPTDKPRSNPLDLEAFRSLPNEVYHLLEHPETAVLKEEYLRTIAAMTYASLTGNKELLLTSQDFMLYQKNVPKVSDFCYVIPIDAQDEYANFKKAWDCGLQRIAEYYVKHRFPVTLNMHARFLKGTDAVLSPFFTRDKNQRFVSIEFLALTPANRADWNNFCRDISSDWQALGGLSHWGKEWTTDPSYLQFFKKRLNETNPEGFQRFKDLRNQLDPHGMFRNPSLESLFE